MSVGCEELQNKQVRGGPIFIYNLVIAYGDEAGGAMCMVWTSWWGRNVGRGNNKDTEAALILD